MSKGVVIHLDNDVKGILEPAKNLFDQMSLDLDYITCCSKDEFESHLKDPSLPIKSLIFDLMDTSSSDPDFLEKVETAFLHYNVPVFIYSGFIESISNIFNNNGTVYKFDKANTDIEVIFKKIQFYNNSGFIDVFCPGGILEREIGKELNASFTKQFSNNNEIESVINTISKTEGTTEDITERVKNVFKRIAIKSLAADLLAPIAESLDKVNPIEHFYKRQSHLDFWTGDIWKNKADNVTYVVVLTPRCDVANDKVKNILLCEIKPLPEPIKLTGDEKKVKEKLRKYLTDNLDCVKTKRYIPETIYFKQGGFVDFSTYHTIEKDSFTRIYEYVVTLSDDFTNEILGKLSYFFLRTGISTISESEFKTTIESLKIEENGDL